MRSSPRSRSVSLSGQMIVTFVMLVAATVIGLTIVADQSALENLQKQAVLAGQAAAQAREQLLKQLLTLRMRRAVGFLVSAESFCTERSGPKLVYTPCINPLLGEFRNTEMARGARLNYLGRKILNVGESLSTASSDQTPGSSVVRTSNGIRYITRAVHGLSSLAIEFDDTEVLPIFDDRTGLGRDGEVILLDDEGRPLTNPRYARANDDVKIPTAGCRAPSSGTQTNYNGDATFAWYTASSELPGTCIVAFIDRNEALGPASALRKMLITRGFLFVLAGVLLSYIAARHIAAPVQRLADTARALQGGDFTQRVPVDGPAEVQGLGRAVAAMANALAELLSQEQSGRRAAEAANRSKDQFLAMLSHELRTPLTAVLGWAHTLRTGNVDSERVQRAATAIERSAESQRRLIEDLLDVTGIAAGRLRMHLEPTDMSDAIEAAIEAIGPRALEKDIHIDTIIEAPRLLVEGDSQRLQQIVWNLVWNAVKFTPAGGRVSVRLRGMEHHAELTVTDTGIGIDPEFLPHVFGWFRREDRNVRAVDEGLGLGLALVRQLVELHGGSVEASSDGHDRGSTFIVKIPLAGHRDVEVTPATMPAITGENMTPLASVRVLVVDDDPDSREAVRALLEHVGAEVVTASSAEDARQQLRHTTADAMVSDIAMAHENGYTLMETLRAEGLTLPSLALTGYARREDADKAYAAGFDVHLPKPVDPDVLVSVLTEMTRRSA